MPPLVESVDLSLADGEIAITRTDLDGRITYASEGFLRTAGRPMAEVMGQPQRIVRHPDVPPEVFADLWATLRREAPWTGVIRNRHRDGRGVWLRMHVTPIRTRGRVTGYLAVRTRPTDAEIAAARTLFAGLRSRHIQAGRLQGGVLQRIGPLGWFDRAMSLPFQLRNAAIFAGLGALTSAPALAAWLAPTWAWPVAAGAAIAGGALAVNAAAYLATQVISPLEAMLHDAEAILAGELRRPFTPRGDPALQRLARWLNLINARTVGVLDDATQNIHGVEHATTALDAQNTDMSSRAAQQAASVQETAASMADITTTVSASALAAREAAARAEAAAQATARGRASVGDVSEKMVEISDRSREIASIVDTIDMIALQTHLLALNAAVEAAQAGEHGRGFAVVADEVRALADRVAAAASQIRGLVRASSQTVTDGQRLVTAARDEMDTIAEDVQRLTRRIAEISAEAASQADRVAQVNQAVAQIDEVTRGTTDLVAQSAASAADLHGRAARLATAVGVLAAGT